jgi:hypothetical protein
MPPPTKRMGVEAAKVDLNTHTLARLDCDFARMMYLSSLRDFNTGEYHHHGLEHLFSEFTANAAMRACHEELFDRLTLGPLQCLVEQINRFIRLSPKDYQGTLVAWKTLEGYHVAVPSGCNPISAELFRSNVRIAIELLKIPGRIPPLPVRPASQHLSLGQ